MGATCIFIINLFSISHRIAPGPMLCDAYLTHWNESFRDENRKKYTQGKKSCTSKEAGSHLVGSGFQFCFCNIRRDACNANHPQRKVDDALSSSNKSCHNLANTIKPSLLKHLMHSCPHVLSWQGKIYKVLLVGQDKNKRKIVKAYSALIRPLCST